MVSKLNAFLLAGALALPLAGTAALAETAQPATPSVTPPTVQAPSVTAPTAPTAPAVPHAGVSPRADAGHKSAAKGSAEYKAGEHKAGEHKAGEHKGAALRHGHADKAGEKSAAGGGEAKGSAKAGVAVDPAQKL